MKYIILSILLFHLYLFLFIFNDNNKDKIEYNNFIKNEYFNNNNKILNNNNYNNRLLQSNNKNYFDFLNKIPVLNKDTINSNIRREKNAIIYDKNGEKNLGADTLHPKYGICYAMKTKYNVNPGQSWGSLPNKLRQKWTDSECDNALMKIIHAPLNCNENKYEDIIYNNKPLSQTLVAITAGSTSRGMMKKNIAHLPLFKYLLPSLLTSLDCGINYLVVIGYDVGDEFYDNEEILKKIDNWWINHIQDPLKEEGIDITLHMEKVKNTIKKPGPVFTAMTKAAYNLGADYIYRVNDDTEFRARWPKVFIKALNELGEPYGVIGPSCMQGNKRILTHDFTHRLHMEIFDTQYYPPELSDWWMDDWISLVYGSKRTYRPEKIDVIHHTGTHKQRYQVDRSHGKLLTGLVRKGKEKILQWMKNNNLPDEKIKKYDKDRFNGAPYADYKG